MELSLLDVLLPSIALVLFGTAIYRLIVMLWRFRLAQLEQARVNEAQLAVEDEDEGVYGVGSHEAFFRLQDEVNRRLDLLMENDPAPPAEDTWDPIPGVPPGVLRTRRQVYERIWVRHVPGVRQLGDTGTDTLTWICPHCGQDHPVPRTKGGNWSWSPRVCSRCEMRLQQAKPGGQRTGDDGVTERLYWVKGEPTRAGLDRLGMLLDDT